MILSSFKQLKHNIYGFQEVKQLAKMISHVLREFFQIGELWDI